MYKICRFVIRQAVLILVTYYLFFNTCTQRKNQEVGSDGHGDERGLFGEIQGKEEACDAIYTFLRKEEAKQTNNGAKNNENQQPQIYANQRK